MTPQEQVRARCREQFELAHTLYGVDIRRTPVLFNLKGRVAGYASCMRSRLTGVASDFQLRFNLDMLTRGCEQTLREMLEETIPHEVAHIVCYAKPSLGQNHNEGWRRVCQSLGGEGGRTHGMAVVFGKGTTYEYVSDNGQTIRLNDRHHARVQRGETLTFLRGKGRVMLGCAYSIVGYQGRTLATPVVKQAVAAVPPAAPAVPVQAHVHVPPVAPRLQPPAPRAVLPTPHVLPAAGESKASISRRIMQQGYRAGHSYETIIAAMIAANGYDRQLARGTFKANAVKVGIPASFYA